MARYTSYASFKVKPAKLLAVLCILCTGNHKNMQQYHAYARSADLAHTKKINVRSVVDSLL